MTGNDSTSSTTSTRAYQGVKIFDGTDPTAYKPWRAKILSHYGTWLNGEAIAGIWQEHIVDGGVFTAAPNAARDEAFLAKFRPHTCRPGSSITTTSTTSGTRKHSTTRVTSASFFKDSPCN